MNLFRHQDKGRLYGLHCLPCMVVGKEMAEKATHNVSRELDV
jgi:hypothetical protein